MSASSTSLTGIGFIKKSTGWIWRGFCCQAAKYWWCEVRAKSFRVRLVSCGPDPKPSFNGNMPVLAHSRFIINLVILIPFCHMQMNWKTAPECFLPEMLRGKPINRLIRDKVEFCFENFIDEGKDAASTSYNILDESRINILAFMGLAIFVLVLLIFIVTMTLCMRQRSNYNGREEVKKGRLMNSKPIHLNQKALFYSEKWREVHRTIFDCKQWYLVQNSTSRSSERFFERLPKLTSIKLHTIAETLIQYINEKLNRSFGKIVILTYKFNVKRIVNIIE